MNRKGFIAIIMRVGLLGVLALLTGVLLSRRQVSLQRECGLEIACKDCNKKNTCSRVDNESR